MLTTREVVRAEDLRAALARVFELAVARIQRIDQAWSPSQGAPVFTVKGRYTAHHWTPWTQGFQFGCPLLVYDATENAKLFQLGRKRTIERMAPLLTHTGIHDHGFNTISTFGHLLRFMREARTIEGEGMRQFYELGIKTSASVQAARWTTLRDGTGYMYSANGPHSLVVDSIRSCRVLVVAHQLGHRMRGENDVPVSLLRRAYEHVLNVARHNVYYGTGRDAYDVSGRVAQESLFDPIDGRYCGPGTVQGYSPFSTWTRGLAWAMLGAAELLEAVSAMPAALFDEVSRVDFIDVLERMARATCDFYIANTPPDGIPYWDTGAPGLAHMPGHLESAAQPDNPLEPVDSSAAVVAAQALLRYAEYLRREESDGHKYHCAGLAIARTLLAAPYLAEDPEHEGLLLHTTYHRPSGWDYVAPGAQVPQGESGIWGDYHLLELAVYLHRKIAGGPYLAFFHRPNPTN